MGSVIACRRCAYIGSLQHYPFMVGRRHLTTTKSKLSGVQGIGTGKQSRLNVDLDSGTEQYLAENNLKPKHHPGIFHLTKRSLPPKFILAAQKILAHENVKSLVEKSTSLKNYLWSRHLPIERQDYQDKVIAIEERLNMKDDVLRPFLSEEQLAKLDSSRDNKIRNRLKKQIYHWEPVNYDRPTTLQYLLARSAGEYAALLQVFSEIQKRDLSFQPNTVCDFGSGIGTAVWACRSVWPNNVREVLCADVSRDMNDIAELLLKGGHANNDHGFLSLYFRQFLAESSKISYDIVTSGYSLMELPSLKARLKTLDILWKKTNNYLVIVEQGTNAGFKAIIEARDYVLELDKGHSDANSYVFSPCPNDQHCPRFTQDDIPCNFYVKYQNLYPFTQDQTGTELFCYVVLKKGARNGDDQFPRLVSDPLIRRRHVICRVCTKEGKLAEVLLTKHKHSQALYRVGRKSRCGDLLPVRDISGLSPDFDNTKSSTVTDER